MANLTQIATGDTTGLKTKLNALVDALDALGGTLIDAGVLYQGADAAGKDAPYHRMKDSGASGIDFRWLNDAGVLVLQLNTGTEASPTWATAFKIDLTNRKTYVGDASDTTGSQLHVLDGGSDNKPGLVALYNDGGADYFLWVDTAGNLRMHTAAPTDDDADGYIVATAGAANVSTAHDHDGGDGAVIPIAGLAAAVQDLFAYVDWGTPGAESGNAIEIDGQIKDLAGNNLAVEAVFVVRVANADQDSSSGTATISAKTTPLGTIIYGSGSAAVGIRTNSSGAFGIKVTETAAATRYLNVGDTYGCRLFLREFEACPLVFA